MLKSSESNPPIIPQEGLEEYQIKRSNLPNQPSTIKKPKPNIPETILKNKKINQTKTKELKQEESLESPQNKKQAAQVIFDLAGEKSSSSYVIKHFPNFKQGGYNSSSGGGTYLLPSRRIMSYSEKINSLKTDNIYKNFVLVSSVILCLSAFGYNDIIGNVLVGPMTKYIYNLNREGMIKQTGMFYVSLSVGSIMANMSVSLFANNLGRIRALLVIEVSKILCYAVINYEDLRVFMGMTLFIGFLGTLQESLVMIILRELLAPKISDKSGFLFYMVACGFSALASIVGVSYKSNEELARDWRFIISSPVALSIFSFFGVFLILGCLDTPQFYVETETDLAKLKAKMYKVMTKIYEKKSSLKFVQYKLYEVRKKKRFESKQRRLARLKGKRPKNTKRSNTFLSAFRTKYLSQVVLGTALCINKEMAGVSVIAYFSTQMFDEVMDNGPIITVLMNVGYLVGAVVSYWSINLGRRDGMLISSIIHSASMLGLIIGSMKQNFTILAFSSVIYKISYTAGPGSILRVYMVEILPANGIALANTLKWLVIAGLCAVVPAVQLKYGVMVILEFHFFFSIVSCLVIYLCVFETTGLSNEEIAIIFQRQKSAINFGKLNDPYSKSQSQLFGSVVRSSHGGMTLVDESLKLKQQEIETNWREWETQRSKQRRLVNNRG